MSITYVDICEAFIADVDIRERCLKYLHHRWHDEEKKFCLDGFATEIARKFQRGIEYATSDSEGRFVLNAIDGKEPAPSPYDIPSISTFMFPPSGVKRKKRKKKKNDDTNPFI